MITNSGTIILKNKITNSIKRSYNLVDFFFNSSKVFLYKTLIKK